MNGSTVQFTYKNHRGEVARRTVIVDSVEYLVNPGYDYQPGWFLSGYCMDKHARRSFAFVNIVVPDGTRVSHKLLIF